MSTTTTATSEAAATAATVREPVQVSCMICYEGFSSVSKDKECVIICEQGHYCCRACTNSLKECPMCRNRLIPYKILNRTMMDLVATSTRSETIAETNAIVEVSSTIVPSGSPSIKYLSPFYSEYSSSIDADYACYYFTPNHFFVSGMQCSEYSIDLVTRRVRAILYNFWGPNSGHFE